MKARLAVTLLILLTPPLLALAAGDEPDEQATLQNPSAEATLQGPNRDPSSVDGVKISESKESFEIKNPTAEQPWSPLWQPAARASDRFIYGF